MSAGGDARPCALACLRPHSADERFGPRHGLFRSVVELGRRDASRSERNGERQHSRVRTYVNGACQPFIYAPARYAAIYLPELGAERVGLVSVPVGLRCVGRIVYCSWRRRRRAQVRRGVLISSLCQCVVRSYGPPMAHLSKICIVHLVSASDGT